MDEFESLQMTFRLEAEQLVLEGGDRIGISTIDLVALASVVNGVSTRVAERAAWDFASGLGLPPEELGAMADVAARRRPPLAYRGLQFAPGQVTQIEEGSIVLTVLLVGNLVVPWAAQHLFGEAVVEGWKESVGREKLKAAARSFFGGASDAAREAAERTPDRFKLEKFSLEPATESGGATRLSLGFRKAERPEVDAWQQGEALFGSEADEPRGSIEASEFVADGDLVAEDEPESRQATESEEKREMGA